RELVSVPTQLIVQRDFGVGVELPLLRICRKGCVFHADKPSHACWSFVKDDDLVLTTGSEYRLNRAATRCATAAALQIDTSGDCLRSTDAAADQVADVHPTGANQARAACHRTRPGLIAGFEVVAHRHVVVVGDGLDFHPAFRTGRGDRALAVLTRIRARLTFGVILSRI